MRIIATALSSFYSNSYPCSFRPAKPYLPTYLSTGRSRSWRSVTSPQIRARLRELADEHGLDELHDLADDTYRNPPVSRAKRKSAKFTAALAAKIRKYHKKHPRLHQRDIGHKFNVNPGRVSEALTNQK